MRSSGRHLVAFAALALLLCAAPATVEASSATTASGGADLQLTSSAPAAGRVGEPQEFRYSVVNAGPDDATNVVLNAALPAGAQLRTLNGETWYSNGGSCEFVGNPPTGISCTSASLASGATRTVAVSAYLHTLGTNTSSASVASDTADPSTSNNSADVTVNVQPATADTSVFLLGPATGVVGADLEYRLNIANTAGPDAVYEALTATVQLPSGVSAPFGFNFGGGSSSSCSFGADGAFTCSGGNPTVTCAYPGGGSRSFSCNVKDERGIGPGASGGTFGSATFSVTALSAGPAVLQAHLEPTPAVVDANPANDGSTVALQLYTGAVPPHADLSVTQTAPAAVSPGGLLGYSITVRNAGPDTAPVTLIDALPAGFSFESVSAGTACSGSTTVTCDVGSLTQSQQKTITLNARAGTTETTVTNTVSVSSPLVDVTPANNSASATTVVRTPQADFGIQLSAPATVVRNSQFDLVVTLTNHGPDSGNGGVIGTLPDGLTYVGSGLCSGSSGEPAFSCAAVPMAAGASRTFAITVSANGPGDQTTAVSRSSGAVADPVTSNDVATATTHVTSPPSADVSVTTTGAVNARVGDTVTYHVTVRNDGPDPATGIFVNGYFLTSAFDGETVTASNGDVCRITRNGTSLGADSGTIIVCGPFDLGVGESWTLDIALHAVSSGTFELAGLAFAQESDPVTGNNVRTFAVTVVPADTTPPEITPAITGTLGAGGWYTSDVHVTWAVTDSESEVGGATGCAASDVTHDTAGVTFTCEAASAGGHSSRSVTVKRDATAPLVSYTGNVGTYAITDTVTIRCAATDGLSGVASATCADVTGPAYTFGVGSHTYSATATDRAGNSASATVTFTVSVARTSVCRLAKQFVQSSAKYRSLPTGRRGDENGVANGLCEKLESIESRLKPERKRALLKAFALQATAFVRAGWLTASQADTLTALAQRL